MYDFKSYYEDIFFPFFLPPSLPPSFPPFPLSAQWEAFPNAGPHLVQGTTIRDIFDPTTIRDELLLCFFQSEERRQQVNF
jgi:hypothetical protein